MRRWSNAFHEHRYLTLYAFASVVLVVSIAFAEGARVAEFSIVFGMAVMTAIVTVVFFAMVFGWLYASSAYEALRLSRPIKAASADFDIRTDRFLNNGLLVSGLVGILPLFLVAISLDVGKSLIIFINPYHWDPLLAAADRKIHFGHYPHEYLLPWIKHFQLSWSLNAVYLLWFLVMSMANAFCLFCDTDPARRRRYLWTVVLAWTLIGIGLATLFSSVGPVFYHDFYPALPDPYAGLRAHLAAVHDSGVTLNVVQMSPYLLEMTRNAQVVDINGPSAMPSMHIATSWLFVLYGFAVRRWLGLVALAFFGLMLVGSVYLSWHYAIDGYAGVILMSLLWFGVGRVMRQTGPAA